MGSTWCFLALKESLRQDEGLSSREFILIPLDTTLEKIDATCRGGMSAFQIFMQNEFANGIEHFGRNDSFLIGGELFGMEQSAC